MMKKFDLTKNVTERRVWDYPYIASIDDLRAFIGEQGDGKPASPKRVREFLQEYEEVMPPKMVTAVRKWLKDS